MKTVFCLTLAVCFTGCAAFESRPQRADRRMNEHWTEQLRYLLPP